MNILKTQRPPTSNLSQQSTGRSKHSNVHPKDKSRRLRNSDQNQTQSTGSSKSSVTVPTPITPSDANKGERGSKQGNGTRPSWKDTWCKVPVNRVSPQEVTGLTVRYFHLRNRVLEATLTKFDCDEENRKLTGEELERFVTKELVQVGEFTQENRWFDSDRLRVLNHCFDRFIEHFQKYAFLLAAIKREYTQTITAILNERFEMTFVQSKVQRLICERGNTDGIKDERIRLKSLEEKKTLLMQEQDKLERRKVDEERAFLQALAATALRETVRETARTEGTGYESREGRTKSTWMLLTEWLAAKSLENDEIRELLEKIQDNTTLYKSYIESAVREEQESKRFDGKDAAQILLERVQMELGNQNDSFEKDERRLERLTAQSRELNAVMKSIDAKAARVRKQMEELRKLPQVSMS